MAERLSSPAGVAPSAGGARRRSAASAFAVAAALTIVAAGCESITITEDPTAPDPRIGDIEQEARDRARARGRDVSEEGLLGDSLSFRGGERVSEEDSGQLLVNRYLWRASIETLSFLPLASTDPYGGVIVTDWGSTAAAPAERFKVTVFISSVELRASALRVVVNRQIQQDGAWVEAAVSDETVRSLEDAILTRARQIRSQDPE